MKGSWTEAPGGLWMPKGTNLEDRLAASTYPTVAWNNIEPWKKNQKYSTPDLTKLVQAMVDNNVHRDALAFFIKDNGSTPFGKRRRAKSFKKGDPARLVLTFSTAPAIGDVYFNNGAKPLCQVDASGRTIVSYQSVNPAHMHFKCTHANGKCTCTDHPTHAAGNCKQFDHKGQTHTINGDCEDQCKGSPCGSNGTCQDGDSTYTCTCKNGFTGRNCQTAPPRTSCGGMSGADSTMCSGQQILESRPDSGCRGTSKCGVKNAAECRELCGANNAKCAFFSAYCNMGHPNCQRGLHSCTCYTGNRVGGCRGCTARISFAAQCN